MAERRHGGRRGDARSGGRGGGRVPNEEAVRQRDLRDIEIDDLRQQVRDLQRDIEIGELRQQVRDLQRREKRRRKSNQMRSNALKPCLVDDPLFNDVCDGQSKPVCDEDILSLPVYDELVYDENIFSIPVYDKPIYEEDILSIPVYDKPVYDEDIFYELPGLMRSSPTFVKFDDATEDEGVVVDDDGELEEIVAVPQREVTDIGVIDFSKDVDLLKGNKCTTVGSNAFRRVSSRDLGIPQSRKRGWNGLSRVSLADVSIKSQKNDREKYWVIEKKKKKKRREPCEWDPCFIELTDTSMEIQEIAETTEHNAVNSALYGLRKYPPPSVKFDDAAEDEGELSTASPHLFSRFESVMKVALKCDHRSFSIGDEALILSSQSCRNFTRLKLCDYHELTDEVMSIFSPNCRNLHKFSCGSYYFGPKGMNALIKNCGLREELSVKLLRGITDAAAADAFGPAADSLKIICLKDLCSGQCFGPLIIVVNNLRSLKFFSCYGDWDKLLELIADRVNSLIEVHLERIQVSDLGLSTQSKFANLEVLHLMMTPECTNIGLMAVTKKCRLLRKLHVDGWKTNKIRDDKELELYDIFQAIDVEHNGCIVPEELWDAHVKVGIELNDKELASFVEHVDEDNNGVVTFKEWRDFLFLYPHEATIENICHYWERVYLADIGEHAEILEGISTHANATKYLIAGGVAGTATALLDLLTVIFQVQTKHVPIGLLDFFSRLEERLEDESFSRRGV